MQTKKEFLENVKYHAEWLEKRQEWLDEPESNHYVDLDPELKALFDEAGRHERLMLEAAVKLSKLCRARLERF
jgi:hypothetical protein